MINQSEYTNVFGESDPYAEKPRAGGLRPDNLIQIIWRSRWIVLLVTVATLAVAFAYVTKATPIYTSTSRVYVEQSGPKILEVAEGVMTQSKNYLYTQAELLKSTPILSSALEKAGVKQMKVFNRVDNPIDYLKEKGLNVLVGKRDDIISISSDSPDPVEAAKLVNAVVDSYVTYQAARKRNTSAEVLKILQNEQVERRMDLLEKLKAMANFKKENIEMAFEHESGNVILQRLEMLSTALTGAQLATIESKSIYETTKEMVRDPARLKQFMEEQLAESGYNFTASVSGSERAGLISKLYELRPRLADRSRQVKSGHPAVVALESEIAHVETQIAELDGEFAQAKLAIVEQQYFAAREKEDEITKYFEDQHQQTIELNGQLAEYTVLQSDWEQTKKLCDILDDRIKEVNVTEDAGALNINIIEVARPADKPSKPQKTSYMAIASLLGLMLGGGLALLRDSTDQRLRSVKEISTVLDMPVLGVIPSMSGRHQGQKVLLDSDSHVAEAYRMIRTSVFFGARGRMTKTILVTSPEAGAGKTTLVSNLAIAMAQAGHKTLILDANFRKPMQHHVFEMRGDEGLASVLSGAITLEEAIKPTGIEELDLLTCGLQLVNASEVLSGAAFAELLEDLSNKYSHIVIDSPPVVPFTDAQILAAICNTTLLVVRAEKSTRENSQEARDGLRNAGGRILGTVVTDV